MKIKWIQTFEVKKIPKENALCKCLSWIMLDFAVEVNKKYYPQIKRPK